MPISGSALALFRARDPLSGDVFEKSGRMEGLLGDFRKVEKKVASSASSTQEALDALIKTLHECRENLSSGESWQAGDGWREELLATLKVT